MKWTREKNQLLIENLPDPCLTLKPAWNEKKDRVIDFKLVNYNEALQSLLNYCNNKMVKLKYSDIYWDIFGKSGYEIDRYLNSMNKNKSVKYQQSSENDETWFEITVFNYSESGQDSLAVIFRDITKQKMLEKKLEESNISLRERVKELECLSLISEMTTVKDYSKEEVFQKTVELIPNYWKKPEYVIAKINVEDQEFVFNNKINNNVMNQWQKSLIRVDGEVIGTVLVGYPQEWCLQDTDDNIFYHEEQMLLDSIANLLANVVKRYRSEQSLIENEEKFRAMVEQSSEMMYLHDLDGKLLDVNFAAVIRTEYNKDELLTMSIFDLHPQNDNKLDIMAQWQEMQLHSAPLTVESEHQTKSGDIYPVELTISKITFNGEYYILALARDISDEKHYEKQLEYLSIHDQLTGLYNRAYFEEEIFRIEKNSEFPVSIISIDLNGLKIVNDTMGYETGDRLLKNLAYVLENSITQKDIAARVGGDEFVVILKNTDEQQGRQVVEDINKNTAWLNDESDRNIKLNLSMGLASSNGETKPTELVMQADEMMYRDKMLKDETSRNNIVRSLLVALEERDFVTNGHVHRLEDYCLAIGKRMGLSEKRLSNLALLSKVHDLGKVGIPDDILFKPGPLDENEWEIMHQHTKKGCRIAQTSPHISGVADLILKHHEKWDGSGYPLQLQGKEIPVECRILAVVDAFDAMTSDRPYRKALSRGQAIKEIKSNRGTQFDPSVVDIFIKILEEESNKEQ